MTATALTLPSSMFLLSLGAALTVAAISLIFSAAALSLERNKRKRELAKKIRYIAYALALTAVLAIVGGVIFMQWYLVGLSPAPIDNISHITDNVTNLMSK